MKNTINVMNIKQEKCKYCNKIIEKSKTNSYYICSCLSAQEEWEREMIKQSKKEVLFFGYKDEDEAKLYFNTDLIKKEWEKQDKSYPYYSNKELKMRVTWG